MDKPDQTSVSVDERIRASILTLRSERVMLDADLAKLYGVETKALLQAVRRNQDRFPPDFVFQVTTKEFSILRSQFVTSSLWGGRRIPPHAFTEQGIAMLSSVLRSPRAVAVNVEIMRTFVRLRRLLESNADLAKKLEVLEARYRKHDAQFRVVFDAIRELMEADQRQLEKPRIGFGKGESEKPGAE